GRGAARRKQGTRPHGRERGTQAGQPPPTPPYPHHMSVKVDLDRLADELAEFTYAYLITVGGDYHAHTVAVEPVLADGAIDVGSIGNSTRKNLASHDGVT